MWLLLMLLLLACLLQQACAFNGWMVCFAGDCTVPAGSSADEQAFPRSFLVAVQ
jgi:hypothetical protein